MATDQLEMGFLEKLGEKFSNLPDAVMKAMTRVFGSSNERFVRKIGFIASKDPDKPHTVIPGSLLAQVNELEPAMAAKSDDQLKGLTPQFRERLAQGATLDDLLPEAFAACREAARRTKNMRHYDVQILGGIVLHRGNIAEMVTGEGKTLVATLPAYLNALTGKGVHIVTVNDYLARRDCEWMLPIYRALGHARRYPRANETAVTLTELQKRGEGPYYEVKEKEHPCHLTDEGIHKAEELAGVESFYTAGNMEWPHLIDNALRATHLYKKDKQYAVMRHPESNEMSVIIIDEFTGRLMIGRQWSDGLHQAVEAKHARDGVKIKEETQTLATITLQNFFKLYKKLAGMTGTAMTEAGEFWKIYKLEVIAIPTNRQLVRVNHPDVIYLKEAGKFESIAGEIERMNKWDVLRMRGGDEVLGN